jgi:hypothetical protein
VRFLGEYRDIGLGIVKLPANMGYEQSFSKMIFASARAGLQMIGNEYHAEFVTINGQPPTTPPLDKDLYFAYFSIPVNVKILFPMKFGRFFLAFEPQFNFLINNETGGWYNGSAFMTELGFRCGYEIPMGKHHLFLESGYDYGLNTMAKFNDESERMGALSILALGFFFNLSNQSNR